MVSVFQGLRRLGLFGFGSAAFSGFRVKGLRALQGFGSLGS